MNQFLHEMSISGVKKEAIDSCRRKMVSLLKQLKAKYVDTPDIDPMQQIENLQKLDEAFGISSPWRIHDE